MTTIDDATLVQIAGDRPEPLLPVLNRSGSFRPLVGVLAILPCLIALERSGLDEVGAVWALHALEGDAGPGAEEFQWQPPLLTWVNEVLLHSTPLPKMIAPLIVPVFATMGIVWWSFRLVSTSNDERLGFWTALWLAIQGSLVLLATSASPTVLVLLLTLIAFDGWQRHFDETDSTVSLRLLLSGAAWGLAILTGGSVGLFILGVLLMEQIIREGVERRHPNRAKRARVRRQQRNRWGFSLLVVVLTCLAASGWWIVRSAHAGGAAFWSAWWSGYDAVVLKYLAASTGGWDLSERLWKLIERVGPLLPLAAVGGARLVTDIVRPAARNGGPSAMTPNNRQLILPWLFVGLIAYLSAPSLSERGDYLTLREAYLLVPIAACAALAIVAILQREASQFVVIGTVGSTAVVFAVLYSFERARTGAAWPSWSLVAAAIVLSTALGVAALVWSRDREPRTRIVLLSCLGLLLVIIATAGWNRVESEPLDERRLDVFRNDLKRQPVDTVIFVADDNPPARLQYAIRSLYPDAEWLRAKTWAAASSARASAETSIGDRTLVIDWLSPAHQTAPFDVAKPAAPARFYRGRELRAFLIVPEEE